MLGHENVWHPIVNHHECHKESCTDAVTVWCCWLFAVWLWECPCRCLSRHSIACSSVRRHNASLWQCGWYSFAERV